MRWLLIVVNLESSIHGNIYRVVSQLNTFFVWCDDDTDDCQALSRSRYHKWTISRTAIFSKAKFLETPTLAYLTYSFFNVIGLNLQISTRISLSFLHIWSMNGCSVTGRPVAVEYLHLCQSIRAHGHQVLMSDPHFVKCGPYSDNLIVTKNLVK